MLIPNPQSLRCDPLLPYNGVTFILSEPSRFDTKRLISANAGEFFDQCLKQAGTNRFSSCIKLLNDPSPFFPNTKVVVLMGSKAQRAYLQNNFSLNDCRGYCYPQPIGPVFISTYEPQDCCDRRAYNLGDENDEEDSDENDVEAGKEKEHSPTKRKNWRFWLAKDLQKAVNIALHGFKPQLRNSKFHFYLPAVEIIHKLTTIKNETIYFDIETNVNFNITVFSFSTSSADIYTVPITRFTGELAYDQLSVCGIFRALAILFRDNRICIHNSLFDLFILAWRYKIPPPKWSNIIDTMVIQHRCSPETEKSLGHCGSYLSHEEYHKNENVFNPRNTEQELQLWRYNAKDVGLLAIIHKELEQIVQSRNLQGSIERAHKLIPAYLLQSLQGIRINNEFKEKSFDNLERLKQQYLRISKILIGYDIETLGSWQRVSRYLYEFKNLPKPNPKFINGKVKYEELTASATLYKLRTKFNVPFIDLLLYYRALSKEAGFLKFNPWTPIKYQYQQNSNPTRFTSADSITGTDTYRNSSRMLLDFWGSNKQNVEKKLRKVCIADTGKLLVQTDQAGAEALVVAYLAPKGRYRLLFENKIKCHVYVAMFVFRSIWEKKLNRSLKDFVESPIELLTKVEGWKELDKLIKSSDDWPASERYYYIAKMICHASNYGMKGPTFQTNVLKKSEGRIIITLDQANFYLTTYHTLFPEIKQWHNLTQIELATNNRILKNLFGDERQFNGHWDETMFKAAYAFKPQSTVGMLTNIAIGELQQMIDENAEGCRDNGVDILANGHDAILSQSNMEFAGELARIQERLLAKTFFEGTANQFTMRSESTIGSNWSFKD